MADDKKGVRFLSLWRNTSKSGLEYFTGNQGGLRFVMFHNKSDNEKAPAFSIFVEEREAKAPATGATVSNPDLGPGETGMTADNIPF